MPAGEGLVRKKSGASRSDRIEQRVMGSEYGLNTHIDMCGIVKNFQMIKLLGKKCKNDQHHLRRVSVYRKYFYSVNRISNNNITSFICDIFFKFSLPL